MAKFYGSNNRRMVSGKATSVFGKRAAKKSLKQSSRGAIKGIVGIAMQGAGYVTAGVGAFTGNPALIGIGLATGVSGGSLTMTGMNQFDRGQRMQAKATAIDDLIRRAKARKAKTDAKAKAASDGIVKAHYRTMPNGVTTFVKAHKRNK